MESFKRAVRAHLLKEAYDPEESGNVKTQQKRILKQLTNPKSQALVKKLFIDIGRDITNSDNAINIFEREYLPKKKLPTIETLKARVDGPSAAKLKTEPAKPQPSETRPAGKISGREAMDPLSKTSAQRSAEGTGEKLTLEERKRRLRGIEEEIADWDNEITKSNTAIERWQGRLKKAEAKKSGGAARYKSEIEGIRELDPDEAKELESGGITARTSVKRLEKGKASWDKASKAAATWVAKDPESGTIKSVRFKTWMQRGREALKNNYTTVNWTDLWDAISKSLKTKARRSDHFSAGSKENEEAKQSINEFIDFWGEVKAKHTDKFNITRAWGFLEIVLDYVKGVDQDDKQNEFYQRARTKWGAGPSN